jgi:hypothetical protein
MQFMQYILKNANAIILIGVALGMIRIMIIIGTNGQFG